MAVTVTTPSKTRDDIGPAGRAGRSRLAAALVRRWPTAIAVAATVAVLAITAPLPHAWQDRLGAFGVLTAAVIYLTWGTARGELNDRRRLTAQTAAVLAFGVLAIAAVAVAPGAGRYVLAAGWLAHAGWDVVHHRTGRVVPRWYAEACIACDLMMAAALLAPVAF